ncbi:MAG: efflux RND transporter periplasmic adaptor subunit [Gammaproteobacteria bacterium]|nr:efflux RND transporter periplasmic adaptor subunit [Gammaproteobacteria bacterium]MBU1656067.1 efflux RND transporter periplasmic adaptor subunit [Gammaproteobacteria bacterium]MBU1960336.1 efflux RND transporter periplasmic adaptor subunit [Gammaproteobacteria bacterium]
MKKHANLVLILTFGLCTVSNPSVAAEPPKMRAALAVTATMPKQEHWTTRVTASGALEAWQEAVIAAEVGGQRIDSILVDVGDRVQKGQELAQLAQDSVRADLKQQEAKVAQAEASLAAARVNAERARQLRASGALPALQIDQYLTEEATAKANLRAQRAALLSQQIRLRQTHILAVDDGVISSRSATLGAVVQAGTELFRLVRQNRVEWRAEVAARDFAQIKPGQKVSLTLPGGERVEGLVRAVSPTLDANTRTARVFVSLPPDSPAKAGMFAQGEIFSGANQALTLPHTAVILRDGNSYVFTIGEDNRVGQRPVRVGRRGDRRVEIAEGLDAGTRVVATGGAFLNDGDGVQVVDEPGATQ